MTIKRTTYPTKVPSLPKLPGDVSPELRRYLENLAEGIEVRLGRRGDQRDRAITLRELINSGLAVDLANRPFDPNLSGSDFTPTVDTSIDTTVPPAPTGFVVTGAYSVIVMFWDRPNYRNHGQTEIWRHDANIVGDAQLVGVSSAISFIDPVGESSQYYYWARHVSDAGIAGPFHAVDGVFAETAPDIAYLLDLLTGSITESQLYDDLNSRINLIDGGVGLVGSVAYLLAQEADARSQEILAASQELENLITSFTFAQDYDNTVTYNVGDLAVYSGFLYRAIATTTGNLPTNTTYWENIGEFTSLAEIVGNNSASIVQLNNVSASSTSANASALFGLQSTVNDSETGLLATRATLFNDYYTAATTDSAISSATTGLASTTYVNNALGDYTTTANLIANYYTKTDADSAIASATSGLASTTYVNNALGDYTTTATLTTNYYTKTATDSAISSATTGLASTTYVNNALGDYTTTATLTTNYYTKTATDSAISSAVSTLSSQVGANSSAIQVTAESIDGLENQFTVKIDNNDYISGFGLASTPKEDGTPFSEFIIRADRFAVGSGNIDSIPFIVNTSSYTTPEGDFVPAGVYIEDAFIKNGSITSAKIGTLAAEKITTGELDSDRIGASTITATKLAANSVTAEKLAISSPNDGTASSIYMSSNGAIKVYDASGTLRVKLGNLSAGYD